MSYTGVAGGATLSGFTGLASAGSSDGDGPTVGTEVVMTSPPGGTDAEWDDFATEYVSESDYTLSIYANPGGLSIEVCHDEDRTELCVNSSADVYYSRKDCGGIQTPKLYWTTTTASETIDGTFQVEIELWVGIEPDDGCLYVGHKDVVCTSLGCDLPSKRDDLDTDPHGFTVPHIDLSDWIDGNSDIVSDYGASDAMSSKGGAMTGFVAAGIVFSVMNAAYPTQQ